MPADFQWPLGSQLTCCVRQIRILVPPSECTARGRRAHRTGLCPFSPRYQLFFPLVSIPFPAGVVPPTHFVQNENSAKLLAAYGFDNLLRCRNCQVDRSGRSPKQPLLFPLVENQILPGTSPVLVIGSSWYRRRSAAAALPQRTTAGGMESIIAPHQVDEGHIRQILKKLKLLSGVIRKEKRNRRQGVGDR